LLGFNHAGTENYCWIFGGISIFDNSGPGTSPAGGDADAIAAGMLSWGHVNAVRIRLNEDCWLGINGSNPLYSGAPYQTAVVHFVNTLHRHGLFTIVDMHWNAPGTMLPAGQAQMADADHGTTYWTSIANAFKNDGMTLFDLYNEPDITTTDAQTTDPWDCWLNGCTINPGRVYGNYPDAGISTPWRSAGMQELVNTVRATGATNVILLGGLNFANDLSGWLTHVPNDPLGQIAASFHAYQSSPCSSPTAYPGATDCWDQVIAPIAQQYPVITGELGEQDCGHSFVDAYMPWADAHGISYLGWTWNTWNCNSGPALITDYSGTPTAFGQGLQAHLLLTSP
jgi:hypothetical protein